MSIRISESWKKVLEKEFQSDYFNDIISKTKEEYSKFICYPPGSKIFRAFDECPFDKLKVIIIGQDPYHGEKQANGLCFSVSQEIENLCSTFITYLQVYAEKNTKNIQSSEIL